MRIPLLALAATVALTGCATGERVPENDDRVVSTGAATDPDDPLRSGECDDAFQAIVDAPDGEARDGEIDNALFVCNGVEDWQQSAQRHPDALGDRDPMEVLRERCEVHSGDTIPICEELQS